MKRLLLPVVLLAVLAAPAAAPAATKYYVGKTEQGYKASAKVVDGDLKWLKVRLRIDCKDSGYTVGPRTDMYSDRPEGPIEQTGTKFTDSGGGEVPLDKPKGHKVVWTSSLSGEILSGGKLKATHTTGARYYNAKGKQYDYCRASVSMRLKRK